MLGEEGERFVSSEESYPHVQPGSGRDDPLGTDSGPGAPEPGRQRMATLLSTTDRVFRGVARPGDRLHDSSSRIPLFTVSRMGPTARWRHADRGA
jgi:hypothetical protein